MSLLGRKMVASHDRYELLINDLDVLQVVNNEDNKRFREIIEKEPDTAILGEHVKYHRAINESKISFWNIVISAAIALVVIIATIFTMIIDQFDPNNHVHNTLRWLSLFIIVIASLYVIVASVSQYINGKSLLFKLKFEAMLWAYHGIKA